MGALRERLGAAIAAYNRTRDNLSRLVGEVSGSAGQVSAASRQVAMTSQETGKVSGEIRTQTLSVENGAVYNGSLSMTQNNKLAQTHKLTKPQQKMIEV